MIDAATATVTSAIETAKNIKTAATTVPISGSIVQSSHENIDVNIGSSFLVTRDDSKLNLKFPHLKRVSSKRINTPDGWKGIETKGDYANGTLYFNTLSDIDAPTETSQVKGAPDQSEKKPVTRGDRVRITEAPGEELPNNALNYQMSLLWNHATAKSKYKSGELNGAPGVFWCNPSTQMAACTVLSRNGVVSVVGKDVVFNPDNKDKVAEPDTDYLAVGYWLFVPEDARLSGHTAGVFADGIDPFTKDNLEVLTGSATYSGDAVGLHARKNTADSTPAINNFTAAVSLTAAFGDVRTLGTVSGKVSDFEVGGEARDMTLNLGSAKITDAAHGGFFTGSTSSDDGVAGKWGGQFFGNGDARTDKPGSAVGTFGAAKNDDSESFIGAFGAYKK